MHPYRLLLHIAASALLAASACARQLPVPDHGVIGVDGAQLTPDFWIARLDAPDRVIFDAATIAARNADLMRVDPTLHDLHALPEALTRGQVAAWIEGLSARPSQPLYDASGQPVDDATLDALLRDRALDAIPDAPAVRFGLVVQRADLRTFPTTLRVFSRAGDHDIDRFQETALFPGTPVAIVHEDAKHEWLFVVSPRYVAWVDKTRVAEGGADEVLAYAGRTPYRIVTGAAVATVHTPELPALSELRLDMSTRVPLRTDWRGGTPVNGQNPYAGWILDLPVRGADGRLSLQPALVQKIADTQADYLPLTRANIVRQAFKFLGERYGWGDSYGARDCSGFVSDVYASMGVLMPRNTRDQSVSPGLAHRVFGAADDRAARMAAVRALEPGDLVYIPGHVMMAIGSIDGEPYVIHDTTGLSYRGPDGARVRVDLNEVSVSPLTPLLFDDTQLYVDRMTSIVRIRPDAGAAPARP